MDASLTTALGLGLLLGARHALDADHVVAISTLVSRHRSVRRSCVLGALWGAGHTTALLAGGLAAIWFKLPISAEVQRGLELLVAVMLMLLGSHVLLRTLGAFAFHRHAHAHDGHIHSHVHLHLGTHDTLGHVHLLRDGQRPFLVGLVHGLAGSAALALLVLASIPTLLGALLYILVFGLGSMAAMFVLSGLVGIPFAAAADRSPAAGRVLQALAGATSLVLGVLLVWELWAP